MGGRGKTPLVAYLARTLVAAGERPAILSRGYGRRIIEDGVVIVSDGAHLLADVDRAGDEPLLLARSLPGTAVLVCEQRALAGTLAERVLGATIHLLDDGFQHVALHRDLDLVVIAPEDLRGRALPFGRLRESPSALAAADAVIVDGELSADDRRRLSSPVFTLRRTLAAAEALEPGGDPPAHGTPVVALAAIAGPDRFARGLEAQGWRVTRLLAFRDHHRYSRADLDACAAAVKETGAHAVLTTEKDAMRLLPLRPLPVPFASVPLSIQVEPQADFEAWLRARLQEIRA